jgi:hypothetical protein
MMMFDDSWYGMRRHRGERGVFIPGEGFRAAPLPPCVPAPPQPLVPSVCVTKRRSPDTVRARVEYFFYKVRVM